MEKRTSSSELDIFLTVSDNAKTRVEPDKAMTSAGTDAWHVRRSTDSKSQFGFVRRYDWSTHRQTKEVTFTYKVTLKSLNDSSVKTKDGKSKDERPPATEAFPQTSAPRTRALVISLSTMGLGAKLIDVEPLAQSRELDVDDLRTNSLAEYRQLVEHAHGIMDVRHYENIRPGAGWTVRLDDISVTIDEGDKSQACSKQ